MPRLPGTPPRRVITIEIFEPNDFSVREGDVSACWLGWDEMLSQVVALTHPKLGYAHYSMKTDAERAEDEARHQKAIARNAAGPCGHTANDLPCDQPGCLGEIPF